MNKIDSILSLLKPGNIKTDFYWWQIWPTTAEEIKFVRESERTETILIRKATKKSPISENKIIVTGNHDSPRVSPFLGWKENENSFILSDSDVEELIIRILPMGFKLHDTLHDLSCDNMSMVETFIPEIHRISSLTNFGNKNERIWSVYGRISYMIQTLISNNTFQPEVSEQLNEIDNYIGKKIGELGDSIESNSEYHIKALNEWPEDDKILCFFHPASCEKEIEKYSLEETLSKNDLSIRETGNNLCFLTKHIKIHEQSITQTITVSYEVGLEVLARLLALKYKKRIIYS